MRRAVQSVVLMLTSLAPLLAGCGGGHGDPILDDLADPPAQVWVQNDSGYHIRQLRFDLVRTDGTEHAVVTPPELIVFSGESFRYTLPEHTAKFRLIVSYQDHGVTHQVFGSWTDVTPGKVYEQYFTVV